MEAIAGISAILTLVTAAAQCSQAIFDACSKFSEIPHHVRSLAVEVSIFGDILRRLHHSISSPGFEFDSDARAIMNTILEECRELFTQIESFQKSLFDATKSLENPRFHGKIKLIFKSNHLEYLRARLESMKTNVLLMMTMQLTCKVQM